MSDSAAAQVGRCFSVNRTKISVGFLFWLGGAVHVYNVPGYGFWDALIWIYYVGRFAAINFAATPALALFH